jgi:ketosteroid isomerase-like protein
VAKQRKRYQEWSNTVINALVEGDVEAAMNGWAEDCIRIGVDPFEEHWIIKGRDALREAFENWAENWSNTKVIKTEILSAHKARGIFNTWLSWTNSEGKNMSCTFICIVNLDKNDKCTEYREWNVVRAKEE